MGVKQLKTNLELAGTTLQDAERNDQDPLMKYDIYIYIYIIYILTYINIIMRLTVTNQQYHVKIRSKS